MNGNLKFGNVELDKWEQHQNGNENRYWFRYQVGKKNNMPALVGIPTDPSHKHWNGELVWFLEKLEFLNKHTDQIGLRENDPLEVRQNKIDEFLMRMNKLGAFE